VQCIRWQTVQSGTEKTRLFTFIVQVVYFYNKIRKYDNVRVASKSSVKYSHKKNRQEIHWSTLNAHWACQKAILYFMAFTLALEASVESLVTDVRYTVLIVNTFPYYHSTFERHSLLCCCWSSHNISQWCQTATCF